MDADVGVLVADAEEDGGAEGGEEVLAGGMGIVSARWFMSH